MVGKKHPRGFILVIVLIIAAAAAIIAAAILSSATAMRVSTGNMQEGDVTDALARAGMERATAYLQVVAKTSGDLDLALDPDQVANCNATPMTCGATTFCNRPKFTDALAVGGTTYLGKNYTAVAFNGGAYLVRFDDDADDAADWATSGRTGPDQWLPQTDNHVAGGNNCNEGPLAPLNLKDNPFRDRNRSMIVTTIGIAPGTNPATAQHRTVLRKLFTFRTPPTVAGFTASGALTAAGTNFEACSPVGSVEVFGAFTGSAGQTCTCGDSRVTGAMTGLDTCINMAGSPCNTPATCAAGSNAAGPVTPMTQLTSAQPLFAQFAFNWNSPCNFYVGPGLLPAGTIAVWAWDPTATRGPGLALCSTFSSSGVPAVPIPDPTTPNKADFGSCWTPVLLGVSGNCGDPINLAVNSEVSVNCDWKPVGVARTDVVTASAFQGTSGTVVLTPPNATYNKPNYAQCLISNGVPSDAYPGQTTAPKNGCSTCTNPPATNVAMKDNTGAGGHYWFNGTSLTSIRAIPAGAYYFGPGALTLNSAADDLTVAGMPSAALDLSQFPHATIVVDGAMTVSGTKQWFGVGEGSPSLALYPSLIVNGALTMDQKVKHVAGTMWVNGAITWASAAASSIFMDGEVHADGAITLSGPADFRWQYTLPFQTVQQSSLASVPLIFTSSE